MEHKLAPLMGEYLTAGTLTSFHFLKSFFGDYLTDQGIRDTGG
jgi:hypothetical protein